MPRLGVGLGIMPVQMMGGPPFDPADLTNMALDLRGHVGVTGDPVTNWANQGSLGGNFVEAVNGPAVSTLGGRASMLYDDTNDLLTYDGAAADFSFLHDGTGATLALVVQPTGEGMLFDTLRQATTRIGLGFQWRPVGAWFFVGNGTGTYLAFSTIAWAAGLAAVLVMRTQSGAPNEYDVRLNGVQMANGAFTGAPSAAAPYGIARLGMAAGPVGFQPFGGQEPAVLAYTDYKTDAEVQQIEAWATAFYSL